MHSFIVYIFVSLYVTNCYVPYCESTVLPKSEARFGWGVSFNHVGHLYHGLNTYELAISIELPHSIDRFDYMPIALDRAYCTNWGNYLDPTTNIERKPLARIVCEEIWPSYVQTVSDIRYLEDKITKIFQHEIPAVIPTFRKDFTKKSNHTRSKRWIVPLLTVGLKGISSLFNHFDQKRRNSAIRELQSDIKNHEFKIRSLHNMMTTIARGTLTELQEIHSQLQAQFESLQSITKQLSTMNNRLTRLTIATQDNQEAILVSTRLLGVFPIPDRSVRSARSDRSVKLFNINILEN